MNAIFDTNAGGRLGAALGTGLNQLAQHKLGQLSKQYEMQQERSRFVQGLAPLLGPDTANFLGALGPDERKYALQNIGSLMQLNQQPGQSANALQGLQQGEEQQQLQEPQKQREVAQQQPQSTQQMTPERAQLIQDIFTSPQERREQEKLELEKKKLTSKEDLAAWKNTAKYREEILNTEQASIEALDYIKEAQRLEKEGDFPSQAFASFLKGAEWEDVPGFLSGNAEAFNKVLANFQRGVRDIYGGNVTNGEMEQFLKTIPTLYHTPEGREVIFAGMKKYYRAGKERAKIERQIIKENGGKPMQDLHERVNEKFSPIQKKLSKDFKKDIEKAKNLSSKTSRLASVASYGAGKALSSIPGALKGATKGAIGGGVAGSFIPGLGTGLGALLGGGLGALGGGGVGDLLKLLL